MVIIIIPNLYLSGVRSVQTLVTTLQAVMYKGSARMARPSLHVLYIQCCGGSDLVNETNDCAAQCCNSQIDADAVCGVCALESSSFS